MLSLKFLYRLPHPGVLELWRSTSRRLGLRQLGDYPKLNRGSWSTFKLRNIDLFFGVGESSNGTIWVELYSHGEGYRRFEEVFWRVVRHHDLCSEAVVLDDYGDSSGPILSFLGCEPTPFDLLTALLENCEAGTRQIRAFALPTLSDPDRWLLSARSLGLRAWFSDRYLFVDVRWEMRGRLRPVGVSSINLL